MLTDRLEAISRALPDEQDAKRIHDYIDSLSAEQRRGLTGTRDRLAILAESDVARFLYRHEPTRHNIDLLAAVKRRDVVVFRLDPDRRPLLASMLAAAIVQDLLTIAAESNTNPTPTLVLVDEMRLRGAGALAGTLSARGGRSLRGLWSLGVFGAVSSRSDETSLVIAISEDGRQHTAAAETFPQ